MVRKEEILFLIIILLLLVVIISSSILEEGVIPSFSPEVQISEACKSSYDGFMPRLMECRNSFEDSCSSNDCVLSLLEGPMGACCTGFEGDVKKCKSLIDKHMEFRILSDSCLS